MKSWSLFSLFLFALATACFGQFSEQTKTAASERIGKSTDAITLATNAFQPHMAIGGASIYVTFIQDGNIAVCVSNDGGKSFGKPIIAIDVQGHARGGAQRGPRIGVDKRNRLTVTAPITFDKAEYKRRYPTAELFVAQSADGGKTWTKPVQLNEVSKKAPEALHWMTVAPNGDAHVAWLDLRARKGRGQDIYYAKVTETGVEKNVKVATTVCECCAPGLAVDAAGNPLLVYREGGEKPSREIFAIHSLDAGKSFSKTRQVNIVDSLEDG